jgi:hypothetical protein
VTDPAIFDPAAIIGPRTTVYLVQRADIPRESLYLDTPGTPHRDHQPVPPELGERIIDGLHHLDEEALCSSA